MDERRSDGRLPLPRGKRREVVWTPEADFFLRRHYRGMSLEVLSLLFGCSGQTITKRARALGLPPKTYAGNPAFVSRVLAMAGQPVATIAAALEVSVPLIRKILAAQGYRYTTAQRAAAIADGRRRARLRDKYGL